MDEVGGKQHGAVVVVQVAQQVDAAIDAAAHATVAHEALAQQAGIALQEQFIDDAHGEPIAGVAVRHVPAHRQRRARGELVDVRRALLGHLRGLGDVRTRRRGACRQAAEVLGNPVLGRRGFEITSHHEHRIRRRVIAVEEALHVLEVGGIEFGEVAVEVMRVVPVGVRVLRQAQPREAAIGAVQDVHAHFVLHHALLVGEAGSVDVEATHAVRFYPQNGLQRVGRDHFVVVGVVETRAAVDGATVPGHDLVEAALLQVGRSLEHHVFEQVRKAGAAFRFDTEADLVVHTDCGGRQCGVTREHYAQAVGQAVVLDGHLQTRGGRGRFGRSSRLAGGGRRGAGDQHGRH